MEEYKFNKREINGFRRRYIDSNNSETNIRVIREFATWVSKCEGVNARNATVLLYKALEDYNIDGTWMADEWFEEIMSPNRTKNIHVFNSVCYIYSKNLIAKVSPFHKPTDMLAVLQEKKLNKSNMLNSDVLKIWSDKLKNIVEVEEVVECTPKKKKKTINFNKLIKKYIKEEITKQLKDNK